MFFFKTKAYVGRAEVLFCIMLFFCLSFLVGLVAYCMTSRFCTLTSKFFSLEVMTSWEFRSIENPVSHTQSHLGHHTLKFQDYAYPTVHGAKNLFYSN